MGRDSGPPKRQPTWGRDTGKWDARIPRWWERAGQPAKYRQHFAKAFGERPELAGYCDTCGRSRSWCECVRGNDA